MAKDVQPIFILPENAMRTTGKTAQKNNIMAATLVAETIRTTLGPKGMDKMLIDSLGEIVVTNDGATILKEMNIEHPAAKMIVEVAKTQENEVGDGTTTAVVIAGELLKKSEQLLEQNIHPTVIAKGYREASEQAKKILNNMAEKVDIEDEKMLTQIAITAMTGKGAEADKEHLSKLAVKAVKSVIDVVDNKIQFDSDYIKIEKRVGGSIEDSELIQGIVLDKERVHPDMPTRIENAKILLIDMAIEVKSTEIDAKINITDPTQIQAFMDMEEKIIRDKVDNIVKTGANVVICQKGIDDLAQFLLAKKGIYAVRRVKKSDMEALSRALQIHILTNLETVTEKDIGKAYLVEERKIGEDKMTFIEGCKNAKAVTLLIKGGSEHVVDEVKRAVEDAIGDVVSAIKVGKVVAGAGAPEIELAIKLREFATTLSGREQLAVNAYADAVEIIPRTLAENAGLDPIDVITEMKAAHDKDQKWAGIDVFSGKVKDAWKNNIIEPLTIKLQAITSATEVATMILRIDDVITTKESSSERSPSMPGGMPPGMGM